MDIREHLQADLLEHSGVALVSAGTRNQGTALPALVYRCTHGEDGEDLEGVEPTHRYEFEIVIWAADLPAAIAIKTVLVERYHGTEGYQFGGNATADPVVDPLEIDSSRKLDEYDGDRVTDTYDDNGAVPLTVVVEFMWTE